MNAIANKWQLPWLSIGLLLLLVVLAPYAMKFPPLDANSLTPPYAQRINLVRLGLLVTVVAFVEFMASTYLHRRDILSIAPFGAAFLACAVLGWRCFPYWAMGVYQVGVGAFSPRDQDPKSLIPMTWIGELWRLPVVLLYLLCYAAVPLLAIYCIVAIRRRRFVPAGITTACIAAVVVFMVGFSPDYMAWLMD